MYSITAHGQPVSHFTRPVRPQSVSQSVITPVLSGQGRTMGHVQSPVAWDLRDMGSSPTRTHTTVMMLVAVAVHRMWCAVEVVLRGQWSGAELVVV